MWGNAVFHLWRFIMISRRINPFDPFEPDPDPYP